MIKHISAPAFKYKKASFFILTFVFLLVLGATQVFAYTPVAKPTATTGLLGLWNFNETTGATAADSSGNGKNLAGTNIDAADWVAGRFDNAVLLDSASTESLANSDTPYFLSSNVTALDFWVRPTNDWDVDGPDEGLVNIGVKSSAAAGTPGGIYLKIDRDNTHRIQIAVVNSAGDSATASCAKNVWDANTWYHFYVEVGHTIGDPIHCFVNGTSYAASTTVPRQVGTGPTSPFEVGLQSNTASNKQYLSGSIDDLAVYSTSLLSGGNMTCTDTHHMGSGTTGWCYEGLNASGSATLTWLDGAGTVGEDGATDTYTIVLNAAPTANVTVVPTAGNNQVTFSPSTLTFTSSNWNVPQAVTVSAINDSADEGTMVESISHTVTSSDLQYNNANFTMLSVTVVDNDYSGSCSPETSTNTLTGQDCSYVGTRYTTLNHYPMTIYMPNNYNSSRTNYPIVFGFSGRGSEQIFGRSWNGDFLDLSKTDRNGWILVDFYGLTTRSWYNPGSMEKVEEIIDDVLKDFAPQIDENRIYVFGASMGTGGALTYTQRHPDLVAGTYTMSGITDYAKYVADNEVYASEVSTAWNNSTSLMAQHDILHNAARVCQTPLKFIHGNLDTTINVSQSRIFDSLLTTLGYPHEYTEYNYGHDFGTMYAGQNLEQGVLDFYYAHTLGDGACVFGSTDKAIVVQTDAVTSVGTSGTTDSFSIKLTRKPTVDVLVTLASGNLQLSATSLTFTPGNWNSPQAVTVSAGSATTAETIGFDFDSADGRYDNLALAPLSVQVVTNTVGGTSSGVVSGGGYAPSSPSSELPASADISACRAGDAYSAHTGARCPIPSAPSVDTGRVLRYGMSGADVMALQKYLNTHGYAIAAAGAGSPGNETQYFGTATRRVVVSFQKTQGIAADGIVGAITRQKMK